MVQRYNQNGMVGTAPDKDLRKYNYYLKVLSSESGGLPSGGWIKGHTEITEITERKKDDIKRFV